MWTHKQFVILHYDDQINSQHSNIPPMLYKENNSIPNQQYPKDIARSSQHHSNVSWWETELCVATKFINAKFQYPNSIRCGTSRPSSSLLSYLGLKGFFFIFSEQIIISVLRRKDLSLQNCLSIFAREVYWCIQTR